MNKDRIISIGDLLRVVDSLGASDHATRRLIALMLGFEWTEEDSDAEKSGGLVEANVAATARDRSVLSENPVESVQEQSGTGETISRPLPDESEDSAWIEPLPPKSIRVPTWFGEVQKMPVPENEKLNDPPPIDSLFRPDWTRALLYNALATFDNKGPLDIDRTVELLSRGEPITEYPRLPQLRLGAVVQVLVDTSKSMAPYRADQRGILKDIKRMITELMVKEVYFDSWPLRGKVLYSSSGTSNEGGTRRRVYESPGAGNIVLALTDLGSDRLIPGVERATDDEWLTFADRLNKAGCPFVILTPYPQSQIPLALRRSIAVITWDRTTTTGIVRRSRRDLSRRSLR